MYCQECHQNPATLHFKKIVNGEKMEIHICEDCAKKGDFVPGSNSFSIHQLLSGLLNFDQPLSGGNQNGSNTNKHPQCEGCGMTYHQFAKSGRFGCSKCYETFSSKLDPILKKIHSGNTAHTGKIPVRVGSDLHEKKKLKQLKEKLQQLVLEEEFEEAAKIRDEIRSLEKQLKGRE